MTNRPLRVPDFDPNHEAACVGHWWDVFALTYNENPARARTGRKQKPSGLAVAKARAICDGCPVREGCLEWAVTMEETFGVWGGLTPQERWRIRRERLLAVGE